MGVQCLGEDQQRTDREAMVVRAFHVIAGRREELADLGKKAAALPVTLEAVERHRKVALVADHQAAGAHGRHAPQAVIVDGAEVMGVFLGHHLDDRMEELAFDVLPALGRQRLADAAVADRHRQQPDVLVENLVKDAACGEKVSGLLKAHLQVAVGVA